MTDAHDPIEVALQVTQVLDRLGVLHTIGGSIASSVAGEPRSTLDVNIVAAIEHAHVGPLVDALAATFYFDREAIERAAQAPVLGVLELLVRALG